MRNTNKYPITLTEMANACERAAEKLLAERPMVYGDIDSMALHEAANRIRRLQFAAMTEDAK